jgi:hypothetical protein
MRKPAYLGQPSIGPLGPLLDQHQRRRLALCTREGLAVTDVGSDSQDAGIVLAAGEQDGPDVRTARPAECLHTVDTVDQRHGAPVDQDGRQ